MFKHGKKYREAASKLGEGQLLSVQDAISRMKELAYVKFDETADVHVNLGIDPSKGEQVVRGSVVLPHGRGKDVKVLVFAKGDKADEAQKASHDKEDYKMKMPLFSHSLTTEFKRVAAGVEVKFERWGIELKVDLIFFTYVVNCDWDD